MESRFLHAVTIRAMQESYVQLLSKNRISIVESSERTEFSFQRNLLFLTSVGVVSFGFLIVGLLSFELQILLVSGSTAFVCFLTFLKNRKGRTIFIIDKINCRLIFPSNNGYESTTAIDFNEIISFSVEVADEEENEEPINYLFADRIHKSDLLLTLKNGLAADHPVLADLKNWLILQLQKEQQVG